ncbi:terminase small subunit [Clostridiaceae bacterium UIB06]|nr:terminase small subunit [Clostridiaceae bacterium UIB06]
MPRERSPNRDKAFEIYKKHKGSIDLVEIAKALGASPGTVRGWKNKDKWEDKLNGTFQKKNIKNMERSNKINSKKKESIADEVKGVLENTELTDKQRLFCVIYARRMNATKAYQMVYRCTYETAMVNGSQLLRNTKIREQIDKLLEAELNKEFLKRGLVQQYKDIAFSDIGDYLEFGKKQVPQWTKNSDGENIPIIDPDTGEQMIKEYSYVDLKDSIGVDTSLITEVSEGRDGIKFKLADKMKAMEVLSKLSNLLSDEEKTRLDLEYKKLNNEKAKAEIDKIKAETNRITDNDEPDVEDDGFLEALKGRTAEVWKNG